MTEQNLTEYIRNGGGICGTCARPAEATPENEGYSYCCNDRIEYGDEAASTVAQANCDHKHHQLESDKAFGFDGVTWNVTSVVCADCGQYIGEPDALGYTMSCKVHEAGACPNGCVHATWERL